MSETLYKLVFEGKIQPKHKEKEVKKNLKALLNADQKKMDRLFSGQPVVIRKNLSEEQIRKYEAAIVKAGALCRLVPVKGGPDLTPTNPLAMDFTGNKTPETVSDARQTPPVSTGLLYKINRLGRIRFLALCWLVGWFEVMAWMVPEYLPRLFGPILNTQEMLMTALGLHTLAGLTFILITSLRLHDLNRTAWLWLFMLIPGLNLLFMLWLSLAPGSRSGNGYGQMPSEPGNLARLLGLWIPLLILIGASGSAWFHQDTLLELANNLPDKAMAYYSSF